MSWPQWIEALKARYLGDEASVFLLHGAIDTGRWVVDGQTVDCMTTLVQFLSRSREILGVLDPDKGLSFPGVGDRSRFKTLVQARRMLDGDITPLREDRPEECLALLHRALSTSGPTQGYLLIYADKLFPEKKRSLTSLPAKTPVFSEWINDPVLRASNNLVILLSENLDSVHREIRERLGRGLIAVPEDHPPVALTHEVTEDVDLRGLPPTAGLFEDDGDDITPIGSPPPTLSELAPVPPELRPLDGAPRADDPLTDALTDALRRSPTGPWPGLVPVREALAQLIHDRSPERCGPLHFSADDEGAISAQGPGADWFQAWFDGGLVVRAASEQLLSKLFEGLDGAPVPPEGALPLEESKLRALRKQVDKALADGAAPPPAA